MKSVSKIPAVIESANCETHGEYKHRYLPVGDGKFMFTDKCPSCAKEIGHAEDLVSKNEQEESARLANEKFKTKMGISKRNANVTFDDFRQDLPNQKRAVKVLYDLGKNVFQGDESSSVIIIGGVGTGKTMLCSAMLNRLRTRRTYRIVKLIDLVRSLKETWSRDSTSTERGIIEFYSNLDLLVIDEIGMQFGSDTEKMFIFDVIDGRYENMKPTVIISNLEMAGVTEIIGERAVDRLRDGGGQLLTFDWESARK